MDRGIRVPPRLQDTCGNLSLAGNSCGTLHVRALQGKDLFGIPHAYGGKRRCALKPLCACRLLLRKHDNKIHLP